MNKKVNISAVWFIWLIVSLCTQIVAAMEGESDQASRYSIIDNRELHVDVNAMKYGEFTVLAQNVMSKHPIEQIYIHSQGKVIDVSPYRLLCDLRMEVAPDIEEEERKYKTSSPSSSVKLEHVVPHDGSEEYDLIICRYYEDKNHQTEFVSAIEDHIQGLKTVGIMISMSKNEEMNTVIGIIQAIASHVKIKGVAICLPSDR